MAEKPATVIELIKDEYSINYPYPWRFAITFKGKRIEFCGMPNKCATPGAALRRAQVRLRWMENGTFEEKYK